MNNITTKWYSIIIGTVLLLLILFVVIFIPCPTNPQLNFFRIFIAIATAAFAATIPGSIKVNNKFVTATSSIGVFVLIYLINPAGWNNNGDCSLKNLKATVYINEKLTKGVEVTIPDIGQRFLTDDFGNVNIEYAPSQIKFPAKINFKYKSELDTTVVVQNSFDGKMEFHLVTNSSGSAQFSITGNSISYSYKDLSLNLSLLNPNKFDMGYDDTVAYKLSNKKDTIFITPNSMLLNRIKNNGVVTDISEESIGINLPQLDFKFTNNSENAILLNEIILSIDLSKKNNNAVIVPQGQSAIGFANIGWGSAKDVKVDFTIVPKKTYTGWATGPYPRHYEFKYLLSSAQNTEDAFIGFSIAELLNLPEKAFEYGEMRDADPTPENQKLFTGLVGDYDEGGIAYGVISYTDADGISKDEKFEISFEISGGYGAGVELSSAYNTYLKPEGKKYLLSIPISQGIKSKDFDRFSLTFASAQSSKHYFKISFLYNDEKIELPFVFYLDYFNTPVQKEYMKKVRL